MDCQTSSHHTVTHSDSSGEAGKKVYRQAFPHLLANTDIIPLQLDRLPEKTRRSDFTSLAHAGTVDVATRNGLERYRVLVRLHDEPWTIMRIENDQLTANFQGSPLWPMMAVEKYPFLHEYLGFDCAANDIACLIPFPEVLESRLSKLFESKRKNRVMYAFRHMDQYDFSVSGHIKYQSYVDSFIDSGRLPMADMMHRDSIHDWCYHFFCMLFPTLMDNVRIAMRFIRDNIDTYEGDTHYQWNYYGCFLNDKGQTAGRTKPEKLTYKAAIYRQMAIALDVATGKLVQLLMLEKKDLLGSCGHEVNIYKTYMQGLTHEVLQLILWQEQDIKERFRPDQSPLAEQAQYLGDDVMAYLHACLARLDEKSRALVSVENSQPRRQVFRTVLAEYGD